MSLDCNYLLKKSFKMFTTRTILDKMYSRYKKVHIYPNYKDCYSLVHKQPPTSSKSVGCLISPQTSANKMCRRTTLLIRTKPKTTIFLQINTTFILARSSDYENFKTTTLLVSYFRKCVCVISAFVRWGQGIAHALFGCEYTFEGHC